MQITTTTKTYTLPDRITVGQMLQLDLATLQPILEGTVDFSNLSEVQPVLQWVVSFMEVLGTDLTTEPFENLILLIQHETFVSWMQGLFGNLTHSKGL